LGLHGTNWFNADSLQVAFFEEILAAAQKLSEGEASWLPEKNHSFENSWVVIFIALYRFWISSENIPFLA
jgi:hypothetical protein